MQWRVGVPLLMIALMLVLAGCTQSPDESGDGVPDDPELVAHEAMKSFGSAATSQDGGDLRSITGTFSMAEGAAEDEMFLSGDMAADMRFEWGLDDVVHVTIGVKNGGMTMTLEAWCTQDATYLQWGSDVYQSRPSLDDTDDGLCTDTDSDEMDFDLFSAEGFEDLEILSIDTHKDGSMTVRFEDPQEEGDFTAAIDNKGRLTGLTMDTAEATGSFEISYGTRDRIALPTATKRLPASVHWTMEDAPGSRTLTVTHSPEAPPLGEIEARLIERDWETATDTDIVSFPMHLEGEQRSGDYTFEYFDHDGDGRITENDTFTFTHPSWVDYWIPETVQLYDHWADADVNAGMVPGPGLVPLLALGLLGLVLVARRR